jgi:hypothetical protein
MNFSHGQGKILEWAGLLFFFFRLVIDLDVDGRNVVLRHISAYAGRGQVWPHVAGKMGTGSLFAFVGVVIVAFLARGGESHE